MFTSSLHMYLCDLNVFLVIVGGLMDRSSAETEAKLLDAIAVCWSIREDLCGLGRIMMGLWSSRIAVELCGWHVEAWWRRIWEDEGEDGCVATLLLLLVMSLCVWSCLCGTRTGGDEEEEEEEEEEAQARDGDGDGSNLEERIIRECILVLFLLSQQHPKLTPFLKPRTSFPAVFQQTAGNSCFRFFAFSDSAPRALLFLIIQRIHMHIHACIHTDMHTHTHTSTCLLWHKS